ncbi:CLUMA_CG010390, isoform A [Clunio marinus]|uniref:CLUMA_CG010390, isoform A n=1 Tax=Clunio marinus TaxID=568069 RepID=A0A1J1ID52_9DIPT|nr:CLUMA_CG010390, isoform A [Clunio marinus]
MVEPPKNKVVRNCQWKAEALRQSIENNNKTLEFIWKTSTVFGQHCATFFQDLMKSKFVPIQDNLMFDINDGEFIETNLTFNFKVIHLFSGKIDFISPSYFDAHMGSCQAKVAQFLVSSPQAQVKHQVFMILAVAVQMRTLLTFRSFPISSHIISSVATEENAGNFTFDLNTKAFDSIGNSWKPPDVNYY